MEVFNSLFSDVFTSENVRNKISTRTTGENFGDKIQNYDDEFRNSCGISLKNSSDDDSNSVVNLVPVSEIPLKYQSVFRSFPYFNVVQSKVFEDRITKQDSRGYIADGWPDLRLDVQVSVDL
ncbi:hypothetical protein TNCV_225491 [Trichonephila clavipes]|nr:hypothetical protein TNCV_225491 [Trichonephila clavipes]